MPAPIISKLKNSTFLLFLALILGIVYAHLKMSIADPDLWGLLSFGALIKQNPGDFFGHFFPMHDLFSYTAEGHPWVYHEWGSGILFYQCLKIFGDWGLTLLLLLINFFFLRVCFNSYQLTQQSIPQKDLSNPLTEQNELNRFFAFTVLGIFILGHNLFYALRCQLFSYLFFSVFLFSLLKYRHTQASKTIWLLPMLMLIWVNLHGGFVLGFFLIGLFWLDSLIQYWQHKTTQSKAALFNLSFTFLLCFGASLINPYGFSFYTEMLSAWNLSREGISEWYPTIFVQPFQGFLLAVLFFVALSGSYKTWLKDKKSNWLPLAILAATGYQAMAHYKLMPYFLLACLSLCNFIQPPQLKLPDWLFRISNSLYQTTPTLLCVIFPILIIAELLGPTPYALKVYDQLTPQNKVLAYPVSALQFLEKQNTTGNLWVEFSWGEYAMWRLFPKMKISVDGRYETVYPEHVKEDNVHFFTPPYDIGVLAQYPTTTHMLIPTQLTPLIQKLDTLSSWQKIYSDSTATIYQKAALIKTPIITVQTRPDNQPLITPISDHIGDLGRFKLKPNYIKRPY